MTGRVYCGSCFQKVSVCPWLAHYVGACAKTEDYLGEPIVEQSCLPHDKQGAERRGSQGPCVLFKGTSLRPNITSPGPHSLKVLATSHWSHELGTKLHTQAFGETAKTQMIPRCFMNEKDGF